MIELISGLIAGMFTGTGMGGGTILILLLSIFANLDQHSSQGVNLVFFILTTISAIIVNIKGKFIDFKLGFKIILYGIIGAIIGSELARKIESQNLKTYFSCFLVAIGIYEIITSLKRIKKAKNNTKNV